MYNKYLRFENTINNNYFRFLSILCIDDDPQFSPDTDSPEETDDETTGCSSSSLHIDQCECPCCCMSGPPSQPLNVKESKQTYSHHSHHLNRKKSYSRSIQPNWYKRYRWISVCISSYKIFCHSCRFAKQKGFITFCNRQKNNFVDVGFSNWKNALEKLEEHDKSESHQEALLNVAAHDSAIDVGAQLSTELRKSQNYHQSMLLKLLSPIQFMVRQGLPLRAHFEDTDHLDGNLYKLLLLRAEHCHELKSWVYRKEYTSPDIVNEIIAIMGQKILRDLLARIKRSSWFTIIADEATDIKRNEQMSLSIRWTDEEYKVYEECIGLMQLPNTKAQTIFNMIKDLLIRCSLPLSQCRGQAYDGAASMSGVTNGVQSLVKKVENRALYVHCLAHNLNLSVQKTKQQCEVIRNVMEFLSDLLQLITYSPKRLALFNSIRSQAALDRGELTPSLRSICPRWTVRNGAISSIILNYDAVSNTLDDVSRGNDECAAKASGLLIKMESFEVFFGLKLAHLIFSASEQFSTNLQAKDNLVFDAIRGAELLISHFKSLSDESNFDRSYEDILQKSEGVTDEPILPRYRKRPKRVDDGVQPHCYKSPKDRYRHMYFESLELACGEVERRFKQPDFLIIEKLENLLITTANGENTETVEALLKYLEGDVDKSRFVTQL